MADSSRYRDAKRRVAERMRGETQVQRAVQPVGGANGRWSLLQRAGVLGPLAPAETRADQLVRLLLARYGVLTRDCLQREDLPFDWSQLYPLLDRMELRGEVRRGYFVTGLAGLQFALPEAVERLRAPGRSDEAIVLLSALDPALLTGLDAPDALQVARLPSTHVALLTGRAIVIFEDSGARITASADAHQDAIQRAIAAYQLRPGAPKRITVTHWNGAEVLGSAGQALLKARGFSQSLQGMEYWSA
jgi:ATP-dependent helicase Lhr and Lhr-like helicase